MADERDAGNQKRGLNKTRVTSLPQQGVINVNNQPGPLESASTLHPAPTPPVQQAEAPPAALVSKLDREVRRNSLQKEGDTGMIQQRYYCHQHRPLEVPEAVSVQTSQTSTPKKNGGPLRPGMSGGSEPLAHGNRSFLIFQMMVINNIAILI